MFIYGKNILSMKKYACLLLMLLLATAGPILAQDTEEESSSRQLATHEPGERAQSFYFELLGPGITYSFNYDTRFQNTLNGLGGRAGVGYIAIDGNTVFSTPLMLNYLLGKEGRYFEMGLGATYISFTGDSDENDVLFVDESQVFGTMVFGYRRQPVDGGFMFRAGISPIFGQGNFVPYYGYLSLGYTF